MPNQCMVTGNLFKKINTIATNKNKRNFDMNKYKKKKKVNAKEKGKEKKKNMEKKKYIVYPM